MKLIAVRAMSALAITASMLAFVPAQAHAEDTGAPAPRAGATSRLTTVDPSGFVDSIAPAENAGLLNYCVQNEYVPYDEAFRTLQAYVKKTNAVPAGNEGNPAYAVGTAGQLQANGHTYSIALAVLPVRQKTCAAVYARAKAAL